jgi:hypothetical protein
MTALDLRIEYRFATGVSPTYGKDGWGHNYKGGLTQDYAEWVETQFMIGRRMREVFQRNTGNRATFYDYKNDYHLFVKEYKNFLEEEFLRIYNKIFNETY